MFICSTGKAGASCVTSSGLLGNCVSAGSCRIDGATSGRCPFSTVCCLRVSSSSRVRTQQLPPQRPMTPPPRRRLCVYRRPVTSPNVGLLARSGRVRRSPQRSRFSRRRLQIRPSSSFNRRPQIRPPRPEPTAVFVTNGSPVDGPDSQGTGVIGTGPRPVRLNLDNVLSKIRRPPTTRTPTVVTPRPPATRRPVVVKPRPPVTRRPVVVTPRPPVTRRPVVVTPRPPATRRPVVVTTRPTVVRYETYVDFC